ncbi:MAG TPA: bifunctional enoyl-CoA hydratase/phosphate acetyltransferase [Burkholderiaceae bacterium]|nr:bifunctional enoyl-CoA hydratase/phosphate acetyltransferase [Burkholderiaceae bacterium]
MHAISNIPFDEIEIGRPLSVTRTLSKTDIEALAFASGDIDAFSDDEAPQADTQRSTEAVGAECLIAHLINRRLPGPGSSIVAQDFRFTSFLTVGDEVSATLLPVEKIGADHLVVFDCRVVNQNGEDVLTGRATVRAPTERQRRGDLTATEMIFRRTDVFAKILRACEGIPPVTTAVVHPCDRDSLRGAIEAAERKLILPVLVGPEARIRSLAASEGLDLAPWRVVGTEHSHAAAQKAAELARTGEVEGLMKGSLHTDELMSMVVAASSGLRTSRRISHVFLMDVPSYPRMLLVTDAAINIAPDARTKADIAQNAIDLARVLRVDVPKVAVLAAVETVNADMQATVDAAMLCKMADRGQITGGLIDGPLAFDNAVSEHAARTKHIVSPVAGRADILLVPDLEAGNMVAKQLQYLAGADSAGIVLGARVPIVLTSRADSVRTRLASAAVMKLLAHARRHEPVPPPV